MDVTETDKTRPRKKCLAICVGIHIIHLACLHSVYFVNTKLSAAPTGVSSIRAFFFFGICTHSYMRSVNSKSFIWIQWMF